MHASNKAALRSITRIAAKEWRPYNINLNNVNPLNPSQKSENINDDPEAKASTEAIVNAIPMRRWGDTQKDVGSVCLLVTGDNSGIGYQTALALARQGYHVIIHGRNDKRFKLLWLKLKNSQVTKNLIRFVLW